MNKPDLSKLRTAVKQAVARLRALPIWEQKAIDRVSKQAAPKPPKPESFVFSRPDWKAIPVTTTCQVAMPYQIARRSQPRAFGVVQHIVKCGCPYCRRFTTLPGALTDDRVQCTWCGEEFRV